MTGVSHTRQPRRRRPGNRGDAIHWRYGQAALMATALAVACDAERAAPRATRLPFWDRMATVASLFAWNVGRRRCLGKVPVDPDLAAANAVTRGGWWPACHVPPVGHLVTLRDLACTQRAV